MSASPPPVLLVKAVRRGDTRTIDLFGLGDSAPKPATAPPAAPVSAPAVAPTAVPPGAATAIKQLPVKVITRKDGHTQTYHVAPEEAPKTKPDAPKVADYQVGPEKLAATYEVDPRRWQGKTTRPRGIDPDFYANGDYPWEMGLESFEHAANKGAMSPGVGFTGKEVIDLTEKYGGTGFKLFAAMAHAVMSGKEVPPEAHDWLKRYQQAKAKGGNWRSIAATSESEVKPDAPLDSWDREQLVDWHRLGKPTLGLHQRHANHWSTLSERQQADIAASAAEKDRQAQQAVQEHDQAQAREAAVYATVKDKLLRGDALSDADLKGLDLRPAGADFRYLSPVAQRLFGISRAKVRTAMGDALQAKFTDEGGQFWVANPRKALANAAAWVQANTNPKPTHYRVHLTSPFGEFAVYVRADKQASLDDYRKYAKTAMVTDMGAAALSWSSQAQIKVVGEPEPVSSVPDNASQVRLAAWAHIAKVERTPAAQTDRTALLDDKEDLADERVRNPGSAKAKELEARIAAAEGIPETPQAETKSMKGIEAVPDDVLNGVKRAVNRLREIRGSADRAIENLDKRFGGEGRYEADVLWESRADVVSSMAVIDEFRFYAPQNEVDAEKVLKELGGVPDLTPTAQAKEWLDRHQEKEREWQEREAKAKTDPAQKREEAADQLPASEAEALAAIEQAKREREAKAEKPELTAEALATKREAIQVLQAFIDGNPNDARIPQWRQRQATLRAEAGDPEPEPKTEQVMPANAPKPLDTSDWSAPQQAAYALMQDYKRDYPDMALNNRAIGAFKRRVRALAKRTPENDDRAVLILTNLMTRLGATWQDKSLEFAPAIGNSDMVAKAVNRHLGGHMGDMLAPLATATVIIPTYTKEDGTVVTAHPAKVRRRVKTVTAVTPRQAALEAAIDHLSTDSRQKDIPREHRQEDAATVAKLKRVATQSPQKQKQALKEVVEHLEEDQGSPKLSSAEHKEDRAMLNQLKAAVKSPAAEAAAKPKPKWAEEPAPTGEILARYPNREDGVEGRVVQHADGRYAAILWDADADHAVGIKIFPDLERAQEQARRMANAPAADAPDDLPPSVQPDPAKPEPTRAALTPTERDVQSYTQHLTTPAVILAAATLRHQLGIQDQLRAMVALSTGKVPGAAELTAAERATAAWLAANLQLTHRVYERIPQGNGGWSGVSREEPITAAAHLDGESVRDALLLELGYGRKFINARPADAFSDLGVQWGALRATDGEQGYFDDSPAAWARRVQSLLNNKADVARAQYLLGSAAWLTPKTPGDKAGVMAEITRLGLATPEQFEQGLERHFSLTAPLKKEVQGGAPSREDLIAGTRSLDDLVLYRLVGTLNQAKVHAFATAVKTLQGRLRPALAGLDPKDAGYWAAYRQALTATGWQEVKVNSAFNRKQVFALQAPGGGLVELGLRSFANASSVFAFPGEPRTYLHRAPDRLSAISQYLETLGALRPPTMAEVAAAQPKEQRPAPERVPVTYAPVVLAKRGPSPAAFYGRATRADMDSGAKAIRTLMRQDLKRGLAAGRLPTGIQVSITGDARSIDLRLTGVPEGMPVLNPAWVVARANGFDPEYGEERVPRYAPATQQVLDDLEAIFRKYRWDESDSMTDYFRANYWGGAAVSYQLEDRYDHLVPKASAATPGDTVTVDGVTYRLSGEPPRWHRADHPVPPNHPAPRGPAKVVKVTATPGPEARQRQADKLRAAADSLAARAQATQAAERLTNTARRARMASGALEQAAKQAALAESARNLAAALAAGQVTHLAKVNSLAAVETLDSLLQDAMYRRDRERWEYRDRERNRGRPAETADLDYVTWPHSEATVARLQRLGILQQAELRAALGEYLTQRAGAKALDPVKAAELAIAGQKVGVDFFPTPKPLAARMATLAGIKPGMRVLEPSAGNGHLADAARAQGAEVDAVEVSDALRNILGAKGHRLAGRDFNEFEAAQPYDAILMNPPFSDRQDAAHIQRAWELLKPGGTLVAIAGEGVFFGQDRAAQAFRGWLDERGAEVEKLPAGSFLDRTLPQTTGVNARLLILRKPAGMVAKALFASSPTWRLPYLPRLTLVRRAA